MKHEADGLYYVNVRMLRKAGACKSSRDRFKRLFGTGNIPLTLENAQLADDNCISLDWATCEMYIIDAISFSEWNGFSNYPNNPARAFMNLIAKRAKREGKL